MDVIDTVVVYILNFIITLINNNTTSKLRVYHSCDIIAMCLSAPSTDTIKEIYIYIFVTDLFESIIVYDRTWHHELTHYFCYCLLNNLLMW